MRAFEIAASQPWAISEPWLRTILEIAARENSSVEAVEAKLGRPLDNTQKVTMRGTVALVPVNGPIFRYANLFADISGGTSVATLATDFAAAMSDPSVTGIILNVNSPGGEIDGISEMADMIRAGAQTKPVVAYVSNLGASAAYWLASAASQIVIADTALVGSIGTVMAVRDPTKATAKDLEFVSSQSPNKRPNPTTEAGKSQIQALVDGLTDVFVAKIAAFRGVSEQTVLSDFGQGGMLVGEIAVEAGLADAVGSLEGVIANMRPKSGGYTAMAPMECKCCAKGTCSCASMKSGSCSCGADCPGCKSMNCGGLPSAEGKTKEKHMASREATVTVNVEGAEEVKAAVETLKAQNAELTASFEKVTAVNKEFEKRLKEANSAKIKAEVSQYVADQKTALRFNKASGELCASILTKAMEAEDATMVTNLKAFVAALPKLPAGTLHAAEVDEAPIDSETAQPTKADFENKTAAGDARIMNAAHRIQFETKCSFADAMAQLKTKLVG